MCKKLIITSFAILFTVLATAQIKVAWGNTDTRYPRSNTKEISMAAVNSTTAWRGERVNFQLLVRHLSSFPVGPYQLAKP